VGNEELYMPGQNVKERLRKRETEQYKDVQSIYKKIVLLLHEALSKIHVEFIGASSIPGLVTLI